MIDRDIQRIWLLSGTAFLALVTVVAVTVFCFAQMEYLPVLLPVLGSFVVLTFNVALLSSARTSYGAVLFFGRVFLWLGLLLLAGAAVVGGLSTMNML